MAAQNNAPLPDGLEIGGYRIVKKIASGGFSIVYLAYDDDGNAVAIKEYLPSSLALRQPGELSPQISPANLHVYDYDWSPDDRRFVITAAPGPGDNNWWIAQIYTVDINSGNATSIYKPLLQVATPRWSPDGKSIAFVEGLMSDEGFHGGDLVTASAAGKDVVNRRHGRNSSINSFFWPTPDRILLVEYIGGGTGISELSLSTNIVREMWKGAECVHAFGNFPNLTMSKVGKTAAAVRSTGARIRFFRVTRLQIARASIRGPPPARARRRSPKDRTGSMGNAAAACIASRS